MSIAAIAAAVRSGEASAAGIVEQYLGVIEAMDAGVGAFLEVAGEAAIAAARRVDALMASGEDPGPLAGVPLAVKDNMCTRGVATTCASRILAGWRPPYDATAVARLAAAGAVTVGKTNMDEFAMGSSTENSAVCVTHNPYDPSRVPGGSSGGSAAAVAAGMIPGALGSDTGGSIRQPAALCGVVGVKPTYGMVSRYGLVAFASSLDQIGPLTRSVEDAALLYSVIAGHDPADSTSIREEPEWTGRLAAPDILEKGVVGTVVGLLREITDGADPEVRSRVLEAAEGLSRLGATVEEVSIPELRFALPAYYLIAPAEASSNLARYDGMRYGLRLGDGSAESVMSTTRAAGFGAEVKRRIMLGTYALSAGYYDAYYGKAQRVRTVLVSAFDAAYRRFDVLLGAASPTVAFRIGEKVNDPLAMYMSDVCTIPTNLAGHPAMSVPFGTAPAPGGNGSATGPAMPVGVQVLAPRLGEPAMFSVAAALERIAPVTEPPVLDRQEL